MDSHGTTGDLVITNVLVAEDFKPFRQLVCAVLRSNPDIQVAYEVGDGVEAIEKAAELRPDLILLDIGLPSMDGIEAARRISSISPRSKIIFLSQEHSAEIVREALDTGACGYVVKADAGTELMIAVDVVLKGGKFVGKRFENHHLLPSATEYQP